ncbi:MAG: RDD family protein [Ignavibacteriales bacterium CG_4_9_14_3_um_filter_34_10]|nr:MAG: RDD family protein [Ignavibacteriales bacterium CG_4_9_14_3_um_filter_34_10]
MNEFKYAGFWKRFLAHLIDQILIGFVSLVIIIPVFFAFGFGVFSQFKNQGGADFENVSFQSNHYQDLSIAEISVVVFTILFITALSIVINWLYYALMESSARQATIGKSTLNLKVTDLTGNRISFGRATGRYFAKILSGLVFGIGYIIMVFSPRKQTLHDMLSGCIVIDSNYYELQKILSENQTKENTGNRI